MGRLARVVAAEFHAMLLNGVTGGSRPFSAKMTIVKKSDPKGKKKQ